MNRIEKLKADAAKEGESVAHEMSESPAYEKLEKAGKVKDEADERKRPPAIGSKSPKAATKKLIDIRR